MQRLRHDWRLIYDLTCGRTWAKWAGRSASYDCAVLVLSLRGLRGLKSLE